MARRCKVCTHPSRISIDQALKDGISTSKLAKQYTISEDSLTRHRSNHVVVTATVTSSTPDMLRDLIQEYETLASECRRKADLYGCRVAMNQKLAAITELAAIEAKNPELRQKSGVEKISIELVDSIVDSVVLAYDQCPTCGSHSIPKVTGPLPRRAILN